MLPRYRCDGLDRIDANTGAFFANELVSIRPRLYDRAYPELRGRIFVPAGANGVSNADEFYEARSYDRAGKADIVRDYAKDFPTVGLAAYKGRTPIVSIGDSYRWSIQEIRAAQRAGVPLSDKLAQAARFFIEKKIDDLLLVGDSDIGIEGLFTLSGVTTYTLPADGTGASKLWSTKTAAQILRDLHGISLKMFTDTLELESPDTLIMPTAAYGLISTTPVDTTGGGGTTILQRFLANEERIKNVYSSGKLNFAGSGAVGRMVAYKRDPDVLEAIIPQEFEDFPPEWESMTAKVTCHARCGGVAVSRPKAIAYADGLTPVA